MANKGKPWSYELDTWLLETIQKKDIAYCANALERTEGAIISRLRKMAEEMFKQGETLEKIHQTTKLPMGDIEYLAHVSTLTNRGEPWDEDQDQWLQKAVKKLGVEECARQMERTTKEVENRVELLMMKALEKGTPIENVCGTYGVDLEVFTVKLQQLQNKVELCDVDTVTHSPPYYVVLRGRSTGIYSSWEACKTAIQGTSSAKFKKCMTLEEVKAYLSGNIQSELPKVHEQKPRPSPVKLPPLSEEQQAVLNNVYTGKNILLLGSAGTGKTTIIHHIRRYCVRENIEMGITGTTGTAAILIEGKTLHSFLGIGLGKHSPTVLADILFYKFKNKAKILQELRVLIIDEVSMLHAELFTKISRFLSIVRKDNRPFGGLQLILCGDFYQLPPVEGDFAFKSEVWEKLQLATHVLTKIYRQEDPRFQELLERSRVGELTDADMALLKKCKHTVFPPGIQPTRLFSVNAQVDRINDDAYAALQAEEKSYETLCPNKESKTYIKSVGIPSTITLKVGAQVMVTRNSSTDKQLVNGTRGIVTKLCPDSVIIQTKYGEKEITRHETTAENDPTISYKYMPLKLAWALTIHKGQGTTLDCVEADLGDSIFIKGQAYTALSRVRNLESLRILDIKRSSFQAHPDVVAFYKSIQNKEV